MNPCLAEWKQAVEASELQIKEWEATLPPASRQEQLVATVVASVMGLERVSRSGDFVSIDISAAQAEGIAARLAALRLQTSG